MALLADIVDSRSSDRVTAHHAVVDVLSQVNQEHPTLHPLRVTVGDELQGVYATLGAALAASWRLRLLLEGKVELRFGLGGGDVRVIDAQRGIQDGDAWWRAREAIDGIEQLADDPQYLGVRTGIIDGRDAATPFAHLTVTSARLADVRFASLRTGARTSLRLLLEGLDNRRAAEAAGISASANSQRVRTNQLRVLADAIEALAQLP
ncbi:SatD family protein [Gulosibacter faecalis]|uniref:SatD family protein n=1 Tax=Gulosibacter faecalis TaxID=272240 RepID=A0ABW5V022_9MICO|nr:SatD family protein [Gulosibacter faecalis]